jgi:hypothetical protein
MEENMEEQVVDNQESTNEVQEEQPKTTQVLEDGTYRVDLSMASAEPTEAVQPEPEVEAVQEQPEEQDVPVVEEVTDEPEAEVQVEQTIEEPQREEVIEESSPKQELPEAIQKLVEFMDETGGSIEDYARLNADYSGVDDKALLAEYYKSTKPHLTRDEIDFIIEDKFQYDEDMDDERDIRRKQLAYKEEIAQAKSHLEGMKSKYYQELKLGSKLTKDQQQAIEFFNRYSEEQKQVEELTAKQQQHFNEQTNKVFNQDFKGFDFKVGDKKFRYNVKDVAETKEAQSNVLNAFSKYVDNNNLLSDAKGYHKSLFAARNPDALANHFYEQGKADAIKEMTSQAKNINVDNRKTNDGFVQAGGTKVRVVSGENSSSTKLRLKNY